MTDLILRSLRRRRLRHREMELRLIVQKIPLKILFMMQQLFLILEEETMENLLQIMVLVESS